MPFLATTTTRVVCVLPWPLLSIGRRSLSHAGLVRRKAVLALFRWSPVFLKMTPDSSKSMRHNDLVSTVSWEVAPMPTGTHAIIRPGDIGVQGDNLVPIIVSLDQGADRDQSGYNNNGKGGWVVLLREKRRILICLLLIAPNSQ